MDPRRYTHLRGPAVSISSRIITIPLGTISVVILARWLGAEHFGVYAAALAIATATNCLAFMGLDQLFLQKLISFKLFFRYLVGWQVMYIVVSLGVGLLISHGPTEVFICLIFLSLSFSAISLSSLSVLAAQRDLQFTRKAYSDLTLKVLAVIPVGAAAVVLPSTSQFGAIAVAVGSVAALIASMVFLWMWGSSISKNGGHLSWISAIRTGATFGLSSGVFALIRQVPLLVLAAFASDTDLANFRVALSVYMAAQIIAVSINHEVVRPRLFSSPDNWGGVLRLALGVNIVFGLIVAVPLFMYSEFVVSLLFGPQYQGAAGVIQTMAIGVPFFFLSTLSDTIVIADGGAKKVLFRLLACLLITVLMCIYFRGVSVDSFAWIIPAAEVLGTMLVAYAAIRVYLKKRIVRQFDRMEA